MKIAVMGTGGVGGYFGGLLARAGEDVTFIARGAHLDAIRRDGLRVVSDLVGEFEVRSEATDDPASVGRVDLVLYAVKMYHNKGAIPAVKPMAGPETIVLTLQNGVDNGDELAAEIGARRVMIGSAFVQARIVKPGVVAQLGHLGRVVFGEPAGGVSSRARRLLTVFQRASLNAELTDNPMGVVWQKFIYLAGSAGINAASGATYGEMRTVPATRELLRASFAEIIDLARAKEISLGEEVLERSMELLDGFPGEGRSSLARDFTEGRPMELEGLMGTVVRMGRQLGVPTPVNSAVYAILQPAAIKIGTEGPGP